MMMAWRAPIKDEAFRLKLVEFLEFHEIDHTLVYYVEIVNEGEFIVEHFLRKLTNPNLIELTGPAWKEPVRAGRKVLMKRLPSSF